jgi:hypothetical protein
MKVSLDKIRKEERKGVRLGTKVERSKRKRKEKKKKKKEKEMREESRLPRKWMGG